VTEPARPVPALPTEDDLFARLSLADLNRQNPLGDVFFDFDQQSLRPDGEAALLRNANWLKRWHSVRVRVEGCADPRGTNEYNLKLGQRRSETVRDFLMAQGIAPDRIEAMSMGKQDLVCSEQTEGCWARNRRGHFIITAK
jgi:peptidoglycan-associated lipoprotein